MLDAGLHSVLTAQRAPALPVARLVVGREVEAVAALLPRLFNLCRAAQSAAVEAALGRPVSEGEISREILRDHLLKFHVTWPGFFGMSATPLPEGWAAGSAALRQALFGAGGVPRRPDDVMAFLESGAGVAPVLKKIDGCFSRGESVADAVAPVTKATLWQLGGIDNSVAVRVADHPGMAAIAAARGRGPFWRAAARLFDMAEILDGRGAPVVTPAPGEAIVMAARGGYGVRIACENGIVSAFERITPTDHLLAENSVLDQALATLPAHKAGLGPLLLDILDPCSPVRLMEGGRHA